MGGKKDIMDKLLQLLGVEKLDEAQQTEIKDKLEVLVSEKVQDKLQEALEQEKVSLVEEYEEKFEEYKKDITSKFSNFVDSILEEELVIPEKIQEYAKKGELYFDLIEQLRTRLAIDEGTLQEEVKELLKEAKEEITSMKSDMDELIAENLELKQDSQQMAVSLYLREKCDGLTEPQTKKILTLLEGIKDKAEIDRKFKVLTETFKVSEQEEEEEDEGGEEYNCVCPECGESSTSKEKCSMSKCSECDVDLEEETSEACKKKAKGKGKGLTEVTEINEDQKNKDNEEKEETDDMAYMKAYVKVLKENKF
jgi:hypothetical protein